MVNTSRFISQMLTKQPIYMCVCVTLKKKRITTTTLGGRVVLAPEIHLTKNVREKNWFRENQIMHD